MECGGSYLKLEIPLEETKSRHRKSEGKLSVMISNLHKGEKCTQTYLLFSGVRILNLTSEVRRPYKNAWWEERAVTRQRFISKIGIILVYLPWWNLQLLSRI